MIHRRRIGRPRVSSKQKKISVRPETNRNKICFGCVSVCFVKPITTNFGLFRCFEPISKQLKKTELFRNKPKQPKKFSEKYQNMLSIKLFWLVGLLFVSVQSNHRNSLFRYRSETTETNCFETNTNNPKFSGKNANVCSLSNCFGCSYVCFGSIETPKLSGSV